MLSAVQMGRMSRLLDEVLELETAARRRWLEALGTEHQDLAPALRQALGAEAGGAAAGDRLTLLPLIGLVRVDPVGGGLQPGGRIGPYLLLRLLGQGGMAHVWLAQRVDGSFRREVALKLPKVSQLRKDLAGRFERERDILAKLEHPNIARLYDAGVSAEGLPYLAMEFVAGLPLTAWCDAHRLGVPERLRLFLQVLDALAYAHGHQIIHRDIKPSNILVTDSGQVRLLDFGVAKLLADEPTRTGLTQRYGRAMTPDYASPELARGGSIDAATDVYSLGVVLYELLAGGRPYRLKAGASLTPLDQAIVAARVVRPSARLAPQAGAGRGTTQGRLARRLRGDLDAIAMKTLAKAREHRYASAEALAQDLQRHLRGAPVQARADRIAYRLARFLARHRAGAAFASTACVLMAAAAVYPLVRMPAKEPVPPNRTGTPFSGAASAAAGDQSIAVLPFADMSEKHDQEYFSDGLSEELIDQLSRSPELKVIARTSSFQFKGRNEDARSIADKLGVANLLEGSVRRDGNGVRITAKLIRASDGMLLWSQSYDRNVSGIFELQAEIAATAAQALKVALTGRAGGGAQERDAQAYSLLLQGNYFRSRHRREDAERAVGFYERAVAVDPNYALAWSRMARVRLDQAANGWAPIDAANDQARRDAGRALRIDPGLAAAHRTLGFLHRAYDRDWKAARAEFRRAYELDPADPETAADAAYFTHTLFGRFDEPLAAERRALSRNPLDTDRLFALAFTLYSAGRLQEAAGTLRQLEALTPTFASAHAWLALCLLRQGLDEEALAAAQKEPDQAWRLSVLPAIYWSLHRRADSDAALAQLEADYSAGSAYQIAQMRAYRGEIGAAFEWLDRAYRQRDLGLELVRIDPLLAALRGDPRYRSLLVRMKLVDS